MPTEEGRAVVTAKVAGRPRRLATEKQWRAAIASSDLKPDSLVEYEAPDGFSDIRAAGNVPDLQPLFAELLPDFVAWAGLAEPGSVPLQSHTEDARQNSGKKEENPAAPVVVAKQTVGAGNVNHQLQHDGITAQRANAGGTTRNAPSGNAGHEQQTSMLLGLFVIALLGMVVLGYVTFSGPDTEQASVEQPPSNTLAAAPETAVKAETAAPIEREADTSLPTPSPRDNTQREMRRLQREPRLAPTPTPTPVFVPPPPPKIVSQGRALQPRDLARWASRIGSDYPARARQRGEEGTVSFRVTVGPNGRVESCDVTKSSGSADLDKAACQGLRRYARFDPALNDAGEPIADTWSSALTYRLE